MYRTTQLRRAGFNSRRHFIKKMTYNPPHTFGNNLQRVNEGPICLPHLWKNANQKTAAIKGCSPAGIGVVGGEVLEKQAVGGKPAKEGWWSWEGWVGLVPCLFHAGLEDEREGGCGVPGLQWGVWKSHMFGLDAGCMTFQVLGITHLEKQRCSLGEASGSVASLFSPSPAVPKYKQGVWTEWVLLEGKQEHGPHMNFGLL